MNSNHSDIIKYNYKKNFFCKNVEAFFIFVTNPLTKEGDIEQTISHFLAQLITSQDYFIQQSNNNNNKRLPIISGACMRVVTINNRNANCLTISYSSKTRFTTVLLPSHLIRANYIDMRFNNTLIMPNDFTDAWERTGDDPPRQQRRANVDFLFCVTRHFLWISWILIEYGKRVDRLLIVMSDLLGTHCFIRTESGWTFFVSSLLRINGLFFAWLSLFWCNKKF